MHTPVSSMNTLEYEIAKACKEGDALENNGIRRIMTKLHYYRQKKIKSHSVDHRNMPGKPTTNIFEDPDACQEEYEEIMEFWKYIKQSLTKTLKNKSQKLETNSMKKGTKRIKEDKAGEPKGSPVSLSKPDESMDDEYFEHRSKSESEEDQDGAYNAEEFRRNEEKLQKQKETKKNPRVVIPKPQIRKEQIIKDNKELPHLLPRVQINAQTEESIEEFSSSSDEATTDDDPTKNTMGRKLQKRRNNPKNEPHQKDRHTADYSGL
ncbi:hypothetical protein JTB14_037904 [Gonioctena quinquepunctata]|nr:hypothetical protein JTB14_037904 [Gonioctena quinquepunctata]